MSLAPTGKNLLDMVPSTPTEEGVNEDAELQQLQADENTLPLQEGTMEEKFAAMARSRSKRLAIPRLRSFSRKQVVDAFEDAFQLVGGTTRLALWADENYSDFAKIYGKLIPGANHSLVEHTGEIHVTSAIPHSTLDDVEIIDGEVVERGGESDGGE